jgi:uncharacterized membrane protein YheB (UPF0754 family)
MYKSKLLEHLNRKISCQISEEIHEKQKEERDLIDKLLCVKEESNIIEKRKIDLEEKKLKEKELERIQRLKEMSVQNIKDI